MARLIHLNGPPAVGKSTLARRYVDDHPGVLNCDIDLLRRLVGGWHQDFHTTGSLVRPAALAMITAYLATGKDVVMPQMLVVPAEIERFRAAAEQAGATFVECLLTADREESVRRYRERAARHPDDPWLQQVESVIDVAGGDDALRCLVDTLNSRAGRPASVVVVRSIEGDVEATYRALLRALGDGHTDVDDTADAATTPR